MIYCMNRRYSSTGVQRVKHITLHTDGLVMLLLCTWGENLVPQLHLQDGPAQRRHGAHDVQVLTHKHETTTFGLGPYEALLLFVVIHLFVQTLIALSALVVDSQRHPVLVKVVVVGHGEHYHQFLPSAVALPLKHVVGQDAHRAARFAAGLAEVAHLGFQRAHGGLRRAVAVATFQVNPFLKVRKSR